MKLTDLEMTKMCAQAMGLRLRRGCHWDDDPYFYVLTEAHPVDGEPYRPLKNDAQAMALVKNFHAFIEGGYTYSDMTLFPWKIEINNGEDECWQTINADLNRAICEAVAKMQATNCNPA